MKKNIKFLAIIMIFFILTLGTGFAQGLSESIQVIFSNITIEVDEKETHTDTEPFIYNDRVYAPVRFVVEAMGGEVAWDAQGNKVVVKSYVDFPQCDYLNGELFYYGLVIDIDYENKEIALEQHYDDNSVELSSSLKLDDNVVIILQRNDKMMNLEISDLKVGEDIGLILSKDKLVRGIIISK